MQAQPRGKKRGSKENIDAGGKRPKNEKEPKPFVCAIYRRDIASFLPRDKIQQWRLTSLLSNASLTEFRSLLPPFKYHCLTVVFASADRCRVRTDGFLDRQSDDNSMEGRDFSSIFDFRLCCRDVKDCASNLIGQRLFPNKPDDEGVAFNLYAKKQPKTVVCRVPNLLTKKTAPAILHFLYHLSQAYYEHIEIIPGVTASPAECAFNPLVMQALPKFPLRGVKLGRAERGGLSDLIVEMASEMRIPFDLLFYHSRNFAAGLPHLLNFIANGRRLDKRLELQGIIYSREVDRIIKHFEEGVRSLEEAIRDVHYENPYGEPYNYFNWPVRCPKEAATQVTEGDDGTVDFRFDYTNAHSRRPFSLLLGVRRHGLGTLISKFHLMFDSA